MLWRYLGIHKEEHVDDRQPQFPILLAFVILLATYGALELSTWWEMLIAAVVTCIASLIIIMNRRNSSDS